MNEIVKTDLKDEKLFKLLEVVDSATSRGYLARCDNGAVEPFHDTRLTSGLSKNLDQISLFRLTRLVYGAGENPAEKLKAFFLAFSSLRQSPSVFFILQSKKIQDGSSEAIDDFWGDEKKNVSTDHSGDKYAFSLYLGVKPQGVDQSVGAKRSLRDAFKATFDGTFLGSKIEPLSYKEVEAVTGVHGVGECPEIVCVTAQPSVKKDADEKTVEMGLEHFIDVMRNREYTAVLLAQPVSKEVVENRRRELENLYSKLSLFQKVSIAFGKNMSRTIGENISEAIGTSESVGKSFTTTRSRSTSTGESEGSSSSSGSNGSSSGSSSSWSRTETIGTSESEGTTFNLGKNTTKTTGTNSSETQGESVTHTIEAQNKAVVDLLAKMDDALKRMDDAETFGLWECAGYFLSYTFEDATFAANTFKSLVIGDESSSVRSHTIHWSRADAGAHQRQPQLCRWIMGGEHPVIHSSAHGFPTVIPTSLVSGKDMPYLLRLPQKSVPGIAVETIAAFGRSIARKGRADKAKKPIEFGRICHMDIQELPVSLDLDDFTKHVFITGSTGCGKSNTTELLLQRCIEQNVKFLVVEPAKGEYKKAFKNLDGINIFTTHPLCERLLRINPFRFPKEIHVLEHVDRLLGIFSACWELSAAMPAILKKGVEQAYRNVGWDLPNSYFIGGDPKRPEYPTFASLITTLTDIIEQSGYSAEAKGNYTGALVTRVESLTAGILRQVFCSGMDIEGGVLFDQNTIVDLSRLGSAETKSLLMGILVMQLSEWRQARTVGTNKDISHVTVIEEAHNLLRRQEADGSDLVKKSVESISNAIAEMRTYGEGFLIVDQSPGAVDISAIKNTNTKIVMRLPEQNDCEAVASAMGLDEFQTKEIAKLPPGVAVVMQNTWTSAVLCNVLKSTPPRGEEEWTSPVVNRAVRAHLALACGRIGSVRSDWFSKNPSAKEKVSEALFKSMPSVTNIQSHIDSLPGIGSARKQELHEIFTHYVRMYSLATNKSMEGNRVGYGMLAIALLGCWDCWRDAKDPLSLREILRRYVPDSGKSKQRPDFEAYFNGLVLCVRTAFEYYHGAIPQSGGTESDRRDFIRKMHVSPKRVMEL